MTQPSALAYAFVQAHRYGQQVALLEDHGMQQERMAVRRAWQAFRDQFMGHVDRDWLVDAHYWDGYADAWKEDTITEQLEADLLADRQAREEASNDKH